MPPQLGVVEPSCGPVAVDAQALEDHVQPRGEVSGILLFEAAGQEIEQRIERGWPVDIGGLGAADVHNDRGPEPSGRQLSHHVPGNRMAAPRAARRWRRMRY